MIIIKEKLKKCAIKKWLHWKIENITSYGYNQIFTYASYFGIK